MHKFHTFSQLGRCLMDSDRSAIAKVSAISAVLKTPVSHDFRKVVPVTVREETFWADRATGTLYCQRTGECQTSTSMELILASLGRSFEEMKKRFPGLTKRWLAEVELHGKPGPKPGGARMTMTDLA